MLFYHLALHSMARESSWSGETAAGAIVGLFVSVVPACLVAAGIASFIACRRKEPCVLLAAFGWPLFLVVLIAYFLIHAGK